MFIDKKKFAQLGFKKASEVKTVFFQKTLILAFEVIVQPLVNTFAIATFALLEHCVS